MVSLVDLADISETVEVRPGMSVQVYGLSAGSIANILAMSAELRKAVLSKSFTVATLLESAPEIVRYAIAAAVREDGNPEAVDAAGRLSLHEQSAILAAALRLTLPQGVDPFAEQWAALLGGAAVAGSTKAPDMESPKASSG